MDADRSSANTSSSTRTWESRRSISAGRIGRAAGQPVQSTAARSSGGHRPWNSRPARARRRHAPQDPRGHRRLPPLPPARRPQQDRLRRGQREAPLVFVGEGPGADEDAQGIPFVGRAGQLLTQMIEDTAKKEGIPICCARTSTSATWSSAGRRRIARRSRTKWKSAASSSTAS